MAVKPEILRQSQVTHIGQQTAKKRDELHLLSRTLTTFSASAIDKV